MEDMDQFISRLTNFEKPDLENVKEITSAEYYYDPQNHISTHEQIIDDTETLQTFRYWIQENQHHIKEKVVLDVGCGTGIFSMMAAKAGASKVISVEWSNIVTYTEKIVQENKFDNITVIRGKIDEISLPYGIKKVDVIISFWMGCSLLHGGKLKAVIKARNKFLKTGGFIIPDRAALYISGISDDEFRENNIHWWKNVYGYDMSFLAEDALRYGRNCIIPSSKLCTNKGEIKSIDLTKDTVAQIMVRSPFRVTAKWNDYVQGFCLYFRVKFSGDKKNREINTDPLLTPKMWGQTVLYFKDYLMIKKKEKLKGFLTFFSINNDNRFLGVRLEVDFEGQMGNFKNSKDFVLSS